MGILKKLSVDHPYHCSESNYFSNEASINYETMSEFLDDFEDADEDMNLCFRWDIKPRGESGELHERYRAEVFLILQRMGIFRPVMIDHINESEAERFLKYAKRHWRLLCKIWDPVPDLMQ